MSGEAIVDIVWLHAAATGKSHIFNELMHQQHMRKSNTGMIHPLELQRTLLARLLLCTYVSGLRQANSIHKF